MAGTAGTAGVRSGHQLRAMRPSARTASWQVGTLLGLVAFVPRALTAVEGFAHSDEVRWLERSGHYARAVLSLDLTEATSSSSTVEGHPTMPGITTAVVGGAARVIWGGLRDLGVVSFPGEGFRSSRSGLIIAQLLMALATSGLLVLLWWVLTRWATRIVATTAVLILATEPTMIADGTKLKTDTFLMLFGAIGAFGLAAALRVPADADRGAHRQGRVLLAIVAGVGIGGALASKTTALAFMPFYLGLASYAAVRSWRSRARPRELAVMTILTLVVALGFLAVLWPALWADPSGQLELVRGTERLARAGHPQWFLGEATTNPGLVYYFLVVPLRMTPWLFLAAVPAAVVSLRVRALRGYGLVALAYAAVPLLVILVAEKKFARYAYPLWPVLAVLVGLLVERIATWCREGGLRRWRAFEISTAGAIAGLVVYAMLVVPFADAYTNPLLGGGSVAEQVMLIGPDSAREVGAFIREREDATCPERRILPTSKRSNLWFPCGEVTRSVDELVSGDYIVLFATDTKRMPVVEVDALRALGHHVGDVRTRGIDIAEIIQVS